MRSVLESMGSVKWIVPPMWVGIMPSAGGLDGTKDRGRENVPLPA